MNYLLFLFLISNFSALSQEQTVVQEQQFNLDEKVVETSGLFYWDELLWTHNDDSDNKIYGLNPLNGKIDREIVFSQLKIKDWEELQMDNDFFYIGDFGNNKGSRKKLRVYKISKERLIIDTIEFYFPNQPDYSKQKSKPTNYDCEAFLVADSMLYFFTKEWENQKTTLYKIPNKTGKHNATKISTFDSKGLITGASFNNNHTKIILCGYTKTLSPFLYLLSDFSSDDFLNGNKQKINLKQPFLQVEGVCFIDNETIAITNEKFSKSLININQMLTIFKLVSKDKD